MINIYQIEDISSIDIDDSQQFLIVPFTTYVVIFSIKYNKPLGILGHKEQQLYYTKCFYFKGESQQEKIEADFTETQVIKEQYDPTIFVWSKQTNRIYLFTQRLPLKDEKKRFYGRDQIDILEPTKTKQKSQKQTSHIDLNQKAIIQTTLGDIYLKFYPQYAPKAVENFLVHANNGYYINCIFHRVVQGYIQTGDPLNDGTGGQSIWKEDFEDEFHPELQHDRPFMVAMANSGLNNNGSQFFITTMPSPWMNNKHTIFAEVYKGQDVVKEIEAQRTDNLEKPYLDIIIQNVKLIK